MRARLVVLALAVAALAPLARPALAAVTPDQRHAPALEAALARHKSAALAVAVIEGGRPAWSAVYGRQDATTPATRNTVFNVASLAKPVTAELLMRLAAKGVVDLDQPMAGAWVDPDLADDPRHKRLTPRIALSHQTGFPNWRPRDGKLAFKFDPGTRFGYSGEGYDYLARFAERKTGRPFETLIEAHVLRPMRLRHAALTERPWMTGHVARPITAEGVWQEPELSKTGDWSAADNLMVTIDDYAAFAARVMAGDGLTPALAAERLRSQTAAENCPEPWPGCPDEVGMALGWMVMRFGEHRVAIHEGADEGESSMVYFDPATRDGVVVFVSGTGGTPLILDVLEIVDPKSRVLGAFRAGPKGGR